MLNGTMFCFQVEYEKVLECKYRWSEYEVQYYLIEKKGIIDHGRIVSIILVYCNQATPL